MEKHNVAREATATVVPLNASPCERAGYRPREIARMYGLSHQTVYLWIAQGKLAAIRRGRAVIVPTEEVVRFFAPEVA